MIDHVATVSAATYRRSVLIRSDASSASADLEDDPHRFGVDIRHDGNRVTRVAGRAIRTPWTSCPLAVEILRKLEGVELLRSPFAVLRHIAQREQCTHMMDLAALAISAAARGIRRRRYDAAFKLSCADGECRQGWISADGGSREAWQVDYELIVEPSRYRGLELRRAGSWVANHALSEDELEALFVVRRAHLVSGGLRFAPDTPATPLDQSWMQGACFTFQPQHAASSARVIGSTLDFTDTPERLLADLKESSGDRS
jgi:hypothetical protein